MVEKVHFNMDLFEGNTNVPEMLRILFQLTFYQQLGTKSKKVFTKFSTANFRVHDISLAFWTRRTDRDSCRKSGENVDISRHVVLMTATTGSEIYRDNF